MRGFSVLGLECHRQVACDEIALEVCAEDLDAPAHECAQDCRSISDLLFIPPEPAACESSAE